MTKLLPIDLVLIDDQFKVVCIDVEFFKPEKPFFVDDLYGRFPEFFKTDTENQREAFVRKMYFSNDQRIKYLSTGEYIKKFSDTSRENKLGFIFHMSRCGSTLFSNLLKCSSDAVVFSEPPIINSVLDPAKSVSRLERQALIRSSINALSDFSSDKNILTVIKFRSWNIYFVDLIYSSFGFVPSIFIHRNGLEILSSIINKPSGWLRAKGTYSEFFGGILGYSREEVIKMSHNEYVLRILRSFLTKVLNFKKQKIVSVEYADIKNEFLRIASEVFSIHYSENELEILKRRMSTYSKDENIKFREDGLKKRRGYARDISELSENLVEDLRRKLSNN